MSQIRLYHEPLPRLLLYIFPAQASRRRRNYRGQVSPISLLDCSLPVATPRFRHDRLDRRATYIRKGGKKISRTMLNPSIEKRSISLVSQRSRFVPSSLSLFLSFVLRVLSIIEFSFSSTWSNQFDETKHRMVSPLVSLGRGHSVKRR